MRATHFELLKEVIGNRYSYLENYFKIMTELDIKPLHPIEESVFDGIFPASICCHIFGTPDADRSTRIQRKMDLSVIRHAYHLWKDKNYYDISEALTKKLKEAEFKDIDTFFVRAPSRSMYISLPKGNGLMVYNQQTGLHEVEAVYLTYTDYGAPRNVKMKYSDDIFEGATKHIHMLVWGEKKGYFGDALMFFDLMFKEGKVSESIEKNKAILENPEIWEYIVDIFNFVSKILLYVNCSNVMIQKIAGLDLEAKIKGLKNSTKIRKTLQKYSKNSPEAHKYLDVVIDHSQESSGKGKGTDSKLATLSLVKVRPHFKTQWYGTNSSKSKIIWVESYLRGEDTEFFKEKNTYIVK